MAVFELIRETESFFLDDEDPASISRSEYTVCVLNWLLLASCVELIWYPGCFGTSA